MRAEWVYAPRRLESKMEIRFTRGGLPGKMIPRTVAFGMGAGRLRAILACEVNHE
jgi:hypothetical protein